MPDGGDLAQGGIRRAVHGGRTFRLEGDQGAGQAFRIDDALGSSSILVELPDVLTPADVQLHADALLSVASDAAA